MPPTEEICDSFRDVDFQSAHCRPNGSQSLLFITSRLTSKSAAFCSFHCDWLVLVSPFGTPCLVHAVASRCGTYQRVPRSRPGPCGVGGTHAVAWRPAPRAARQSLHARLCRLLKCARPEPAPRGHPVDSARKTCPLCNRPISI